MLGPFTAMILGAAALSPGDRVLDVGCGCGAITLDAARAVAPGRSVGIDLSGPMLARARENARRADVGNASFERGDAQIYPFRPVFDAVISRFGVMFFADPVAAFANLWQATRRGGADGWRSSAGSRCWPTNGSSFPVPPSLSTCRAGPGGA